MLLTRDSTVGRVPRAGGEVPAEGTGWDRCCLNEDGPTEQFKMCRCPPCRARVETDQLGEATLDLEIVTKHLKQ